MNPKFQAYINALPPAIQTLLSTQPQSVKSLAGRVRVAGIYLLSEGTSHLYVGRAGNIGQRLRNHIATPEQASFAFKLAREATGNTKATYQTKGSRKDLMKNPAFAAAFEAATQRIEKMDVRYVQEKDPVAQYLLEAYAAVDLSTPYNDFGSH